MDFFFLIFFLSQKPPTKQVRPKFIKSPHLRWRKTEEPTNEHKGEPETTQETTLTNKENNQNKLQPTQERKKKKKKKTKHA